MATRPLALDLEIDALRTWLGQWETEESSKGVAREIAYAMASAHLERGLDVVLPQLDVRRGVIAHLDGIAKERSARFVEVILTASTGELAARIAHPPSGQAAHPRDLFTPEELEEQIEHYRTALDRLAEEWPPALCVDVSGLSSTEAVARVKATIHW